MENIPYHQLADLFPLIHGKEFVELKQDIKANGLRESIVMIGDKILDGRNRFRACQETGTEAHFTDYEGDDALGYVLSLNLHRRHLSESQRAMVATNIANMEVGDNQHGGSANLQTLTSRAEAAEMVNVSERSVNSAAKVKDKGAPELVEAVTNGRVSVSAAADVATLPKDEQVEIVAKGEKEILQAAKEIRAEKATKRRSDRAVKINEMANSAPELSTGKKYPVIYCDPPWRYDYAESDNRAIENQYPTMALTDICQLPVAEIANDDAVLFMWGTSPKLLEAIEVIKAWRFTYKTCAVWDKKKIGMGYYFRQQHELLLVATRGNMPPPVPANRQPSVFSHKRGVHSAKPREVAEMIESMYPEYSRIELFCRSPRDGWDVWGNQSGAA